VEIIGIEPIIFYVQDRDFTKLNYIPIF
jgi:hypothetical protein